MGLAAAPNAASADVFRVSNTRSTGGGSFRAAILGANAAPGPHRIVFTTDGCTDPANGVCSPPSSLLETDGTVTGTIALESQLTLYETTTIDGPGATSLTLDGGGASAILAAEADVTIDDLTFANGFSDEDGGALRVAGDGVTATIERCTFAENEAGSGGAIYAGDGASVVLYDSMVEGNVANDGAGGGIRIDYGESLVVVDSTIYGNEAYEIAFAGGGIAARGTSVQIIGSDVRENVAGLGGGVAAQDASFVDVESSTLHGNVALTEGGALLLEGSGLALFSSLVWQNLAETSGGAIGSIGPSTHASVSVRNSTLSGNAAWASGGALAVLNDAFVTIENATITANAAAGGVDGLDLSAMQVEAWLTSSIVSGNVDPVSGSTVDVAGPATSGALVVTHGLLGTTTGGVSTDASTIVGEDPLLGPLANHGGPTLIHPLLDGSPAIDQGANPQFFAFDQRGQGFPRASGAGVDIGAYELQELASEPDGGVGGGTGGGTGGGVGGGTGGGVGGGVGGGTGGGVGGGVGGGTGGGMRSSGGCSIPNPPADGDPSPTAPIALATIAAFLARFRPRR